MASLLCVMNHVCKIHSLYHIARCLKILCKVCFC